MGQLMNLLFHGDNFLMRQDAEELLKINEATRPYGLTLTREDALALLKTRADALRENERVEIGASAIDKILLAFCDSPYLNEYNYTDTAGALVELFYYMKNETLDQMPDDELIERMRDFFNGKSGGSLDLLADRDLEAMARSIRAYGKEIPPEDPPPAGSDADGDDEEDPEDEAYEVQEDSQWRTILL